MNKKRIFIYSIVLTLIMSILIMGNYFINGLKKDITKTYAYFNEKQVIDINNNINLTSVKEEEVQLKEEVKKIFGESEEYKEIIKEKELKNEEINSEINNLYKEIETLENKKTELEKEYNLLKNKQIALEKERLEKISKNFSAINQYPNYPTGCESVALTSLLRYYGVNVTPDNIINNLEKETIPYIENDITYGGNPDIGFVGDPYTIHGFGVYEQPIKNVANAYKSGIQGGSNISFEQVASLANNGTPVQVWISGNLSVPYISRTWIYKPTMETISWKCGEHSVVVLSVTNDSVVIADPMGGQIRSFSRELFENRYNYYGKKALYY